MICDHLIFNALLLTMEPGSQPWYQGYVAIQGGKIATVAGPKLAKTCLRPYRRGMPPATWLCRG
jgi:hypothetical protein